MRYPPEQKEDTRRKIVDAAARAFRRHGVEGASVSEIMGDAGLTVGGFYRHFESKDELFREAMKQAMGETLALLQSRRESSPEKRSSGDAWKQRAASVYLSPRHREMRDTGCPLPSLTAEVGRRDEAGRRDYEASLEGILQELALRLDPDRPEAARSQAMGFLSTLVGGLLLARGVEDDALADEILAAARRAAEACPE